MKKVTIIIIVIFFQTLLIYGNNISENMLKSRLESIGGLKFDRGSLFEFLDKREFDGRRSSFLSSGKVRDDLNFSGSFLKVIGLTSERDDLKNQFIRVEMNHAGVIYNSLSGKVEIENSLRQGNDPLLDLLLIFELRKYLQDKYWGLWKKSESFPLFDDRRFAIESASAGDAMLMLSLYAKSFTKFPVEPGISDSGYSSSALLSFSPIKYSYNLEGLSKAVREYIVKPYVLGLRFIFSIVEKKGKKGLEMVLQNPPTSSEQIIHPKKYLKRELPVKVMIGYKPENYLLKKKGVFGEFMIGILLGKRDVKDDIANGWGGDLYQFYERGDDYFLIWKTSWDSAKRGKKFFANYIENLRSKYSLSFRNGNVKGMKFIAAENGGEYFFLSMVRSRIIYVRTSDRIEINRFIEGGIYD